jgi:UDP-N-acetyl-2-amino-2-deoxyglucuronate dehydrogenase
MKSFALIGAAGYVAPRHMAAIKATGNRLVAAYDPFDSVGVIDNHFPDAYFFTEFERFDRHVDKLRRAHSDEALDFVSICSPNYLHDSHIRFALRSGADVICEKPVVVNPWNLDAIAEIETETGKKVNSILQLRLHPAIVALRDKVNAEQRQTKHDVDLTYVTSRGRWYLQSWKGVEQKSGGIMANIGVHFFDMLHFMFGDVQESAVHLREGTRAAGYLEFEHARVRWFLSVEFEDVPQLIREAGQRTYRSILIDGEEFEFSGGFTDLHQRSYEEILAGRGFGINDSREAINTVAGMRRSDLSRVGELHPFVTRLRG